MVKKSAILERFWKIIEFSRKNCEALPRRRYHQSVNALLLHKPERIVIHLLIDLSAFEFREHHFHRLPLVEKFVS